MERIFEGDAMIQGSNTITFHQDVRDSEGLIVVREIIGRAAFFLSR